MKKVVINTDIIIDFLRGKDRAKEFLISVINDFVVCCSTITVAEIYAGMREQERTKTEQLIDSLTILDVTKVVAEKAGRYKSFHKSHNLELDDCLIAVTAFINKALFATSNVKHYPMMDIEKLSIK